MVAPCTVRADNWRSLELGAAIFEGSAGCARFCVFHFRHLTQAAAHLVTMYGRAWRMLAVAHTCDTDCGGHMPRTRNAPCCRWGTALRLVPGAQGDSTCKGLVRVPQRRTGTRVFAQEDDEKGSRSTVDSLSRMLEGESGALATQAPRHPPATLVSRRI